MAEERPGKKGARRGPGAKAPAARPEQPFFRPFSKLGGGPKGKRATGAAKGGPEAAPGAVAGAPAAPKTTAAGARAAGGSPPARPYRAPSPAASPDGDSDAETFARHMAGVRELGSGAVRIPLGAALVRPVRTDPAAPDPDAPARESMRALVSEGLRFETQDDGERIEGRRVDVDPRELRRLRRGEYGLDGKLDLHGMSVEEARLAVETFVRKRCADGDRVVIVVHGKGSHSPRGQAVLRGEIAAWLSQGKAARHVAAFATAPDDEGGSGALLVLLAR